MSYRFASATSLLVAISFCFAAEPLAQNARDGRAIIETGPADKLVLPPPFATPSARNRSKVIGWPNGRMPSAPVGFRVTLFARDLDNPRSSYVLPNGDVLVVELRRESTSRPAARSANRITLFRDTNKDGRPDLRETFVTGLNMPFGTGRCRISGTASE
jgi:glucose/arabinose dehydrogenase